MSQASIDIIIRAQKALMIEHSVTSETALGLLVWTATERGATVLDVALTICGAATSRHDEHDGSLHATA